MNKKGFTLVEILLVLVILGTLAAMVFPRLTGRSEQSRIVAAQVDINSNIATALKLFELDNGFFPTSKQGIESLVQKPSSSPVPQQWKGPYLEKMPRDPWGRTYLFKNPSSHGMDYDLYSTGKNIKDDSDDITNWE